MIYDKLSNIGRYVGMSENLDTAIRYIQSQDLSILPWGRTTIDGDNVFINHFMYTTVAKQESSLFEDHAEYLDLHVITRGYERVQVQDNTALTEVERREAEDAVMYVGEGGTTFKLSTEEFLLVYPGEAHLPKLIYEMQTVVDKVVFKIHI